MKKLLTGGKELTGSRPNRLACRALMQRSYALGRLLVQQSNYPLGRPTVVIGAIASGTPKPIHAAVQCGFATAGVDTVLCGLLPIPAIAYLTRAKKHQAFVVVNGAWHQQWNGYVGFFSPEGTHLCQEASVPDGQPNTHSARVQRICETGTSSQLSQPGISYVEFCKSALKQQLNLHGLRIVIDAAHSAARDVAPKVLYQLGAQVIAVGLAERGLNEVQAAGATVSQQLAWAVLSLRADVGISINREGNGLLMADSTGVIYYESALRPLTAMQNTVSLTDDAIIRALQVLALMQAAQSSLQHVMSHLPMPFQADQRTFLLSSETKEW